MQVYGLPEGPAAPALGVGLNVPAMLTFRLAPPCLAAQQPWPATVASRLQLEKRCPRHTADGNVSCCAWNHHRQQAVLQL